MQPPVYEEELTGADTRTEDLEMSPLSLSVTDLSSILKWSKEISSDINLAAGGCLGHRYEYPFTRLRSPATFYRDFSWWVSFYWHLSPPDLSPEICAPEKVCLVIAREAGDYSIATTMEPPGACHVHV